MAAKKTDLQLIKEFQAGKTASFEELISRYSNKAFSLATRLTRNREDAEEVLQDVFVTVYRKIGGFQGKSSFSSWLYRVTVNAALMKLRKHRHDQNVSIDDALPQIHNSIAAKTAHQSEGETAAMRAQLLFALERAIKRLPDDYRPVFILRDIDGLTSREVGKILDLSVPAVKSRLHRSRLILRRRLRALYKEYLTGTVREKVANG